jgi:hypothetical protein
MAGLNSRLPFFKNSFFLLMTNYGFRKSLHTFYSNNVDPQEAGEELERINEKYGQTTAASVVDESRPEEAVLHEAFEWDDEVAAEKHRETQARSLIKTVRIITPDGGDEPAFINVKVVKGYLPAREVASKPDLLKSAKDAAIKRLWEAENHLAELDRLTEQKDVTVKKARNYIKKGRNVLSAKKN